MNIMKETKVLAIAWWNDKTFEDQKIFAKAAGVEPDDVTLAQVYQWYLEHV
jgi:hypothetical protein